jgi:hypothetical protein
MFLIIKYNTIDTHQENIDIQCDKKKNTSEQALQIIGHVVAEFYENKRSMHGRRQFVLKLCYYYLRKCIK